MGLQQAERGMALLRIVLGIWLLHTALAHLVWTPWPWAAAYWVQTVKVQLMHHSLDHPSFWVRYFVQQALLPNASLYAGMTTVLQLLAGISLTFGLLTLPGALVAALLALIGGILTHYQGSAMLGFYLFQVAVALACLFTRAGRRWGFDAVLSGIRSRSLLW